jgi:hypothetical protein
MNNPYLKCRVKSNQVPRSLREEAETVAGEMIWLLKSFFFSCTFIANLQTSATGHAKLAKSNVVKSTLVATSKLWQKNVRSHRNWRPNPGNTAV